MEYIWEHLVLSSPAELIYVEGNVGAGKNEVISCMKKKLVAKGKRVFVLIECVERWCHEKLLQDMYQDSNRATKRAFETLGPLNDYLEKQRFINQFAKDYDYIIIERHPSTTLEVFGADAAVKTLFKTIDGCYPFMRAAERTLYLKTSPEICIQRINTRGRECESKIDVSYLRTIDAKHDKMIGERRFAGFQVVTVDANNSTPDQIAFEASIAFGI